MSSYLQTLYVRKYKTERLSNLDSLNRSRAFLLNDDLGWRKNY